MKFMKWHGAGNDFVITSEDEIKDRALQELSRQACHRHFGIGADGFMVVSKSDCADFKMTYLNSDGSFAKMCGNGIRCFAAYCIENGLIEKDEFTIETGDGIKKIHCLQKNPYAIQVFMGQVEENPEKIPVETTQKRYIGVPENIEGKMIVLNTVRMGVPHTVIFVEALKDQWVKKIGPKVERLKQFPERTNVNFVEVIDNHHIKVETWERGAGHTLACGTGICASVFMAHQKGLVDKKVTVHAAGGVLQIELTEEGVYMTGPAQKIATGEYTI